MVTELNIEIDGKNITLPVDREMKALFEKFRTQSSEIESIRKRSDISYSLYMFNYIADYTGVMADYSSLLVKDAYKLSRKIKRINSNIRLVS